MTRRLAIIVVNYGSSDLVADNLAVTTIGVDANVFVVDNFTTLREKDTVASLCHDHGWTAVLLEENMGFGVGVNRGAAAAVAAGATDLLILNPDARISREDLELLSPSSAFEPVIASPLVVTPGGRKWFQGSRLSWRDGTVSNTGGVLVAPDAAQMPWLSGACLWITRPAWDMVGGFDEDYFLYWEDVELSRRALRHGIELRLVTSARAVHDVGGTQEKQHDGGKSPTYFYYNTRNRILFGAQHLDDAGFRRWRRNDLRVSWEILLRGGRRQLVRSPGLIVVMLRGIRDGRRMARAIRSER